MAFRVVRSDDERGVCTVILGFLQEWGLDGIAECSAELVSDQDARVVDEHLGERTSRRRGRGHPREEHHRVHHQGVRERGGAPTGVVPEGRQL